MNSKKHYYYLDLYQFFYL